MVTKAGPSPVPNRKRPTKRRVPESEEKKSEIPPAVPKDRFPFNPSQEQSHTLRLKNLEEENELLKQENRTLKQENRELQTKLAHRDRDRTERETYPMRKTDIKTEVFWRGKVSNLEKALLEANNKLEAGEQQMEVAQEAFERAKRLRKSLDEREKDLERRIAALAAQQNTQPAVDTSKLDSLAKENGELHHKLGALQEKARGLATVNDGLVEKNTVLKARVAELQRLNAEANQAVTEQTKLTHEAEENARQLKEHYQGRVKAAKENIEKAGGIEKKFNAVIHGLKDKLDKAARDGEAAVERAKEKAWAEREQAVAKVQFKLEAALNKLSEAERGRGEAELALRTLRNTPHARNEADIATTLDHVVKRQNAHDVMILADAEQEVERVRAELAKVVEHSGVFMREAMDKMADLEAWGTNVHAYSRQLGEGLT
ncbi:Chromosome partition protein Smc [Carpediemonas membranifera]|uniref:Chromosome partition protein Smc n=1 Tax=Carpediemonas membranifera TaxID=201153 RepID=A0A8J6E0W7_9EUKA|nr:Chromosome partition protein Smc [Carpediemonas membranifera]|eukprot:KAG9392366.1 Chromosome partition protein Smc [Carpediemonas membranifera]